LADCGDSLLDSRTTRPREAKPPMNPEPARQPQVLWEIA
jgi:hypothetical protein